MSKGIEHDYVISRADGEPVDPDGVYFVLKLNSSDREHAYASQAAMIGYSDQIRGVNPELANDIRRLVGSIRLGNTLATQDVFHTEDVN